MDFKFANEGAHLRTLRERAGLTQYYVAHELNVDQTAVSNWERGTNLPLRKYRGALAEMYGCSVEELVGGSKRAGN